jgi:hypothetical protein
MRSKGLTKAQRPFFKDVSISSLSLYLPGQGSIKTMYLDLARLRVVPRLNGHLSVSLVHPFAVVDLIFHVNIIKKDPSWQPATTPLLVSRCPRMSSHVTKRSKPEQRPDPPQFHVRPGPAPDPQRFERQQHWMTAMAGRIALSLLHWTFTLWTLIKAWSSRSWIFILQHAVTRDIPTAIQTDKARLTKIPHHLAVIVSQERAWTNRSATQWDAIIHDICNTCVWSSELGVKEVSVFEQSGTEWVEYISWKAND